MNPNLRKILKTLLRYGPSALFILMLGFFAYYAWNYKLLVDDFQFQKELKDRSILEASSFFYNNFNGRMTSHIFLCSIFKVFQNRENLFFIYHFIMLGGFLFSLAHLVVKFLETFRNKLMSFTEGIYFAEFITAFLFFFFFAGRVELWFWVSATGVYLISLILAFNAFAFVLNKKQNAITSLFSLLLFFLAGGFSESYAVVYLLILLSLLLFTFKKDHFLKKHLFAILSGMIGLTAALLINVMSPGIHNRLDWLPEFRIQQSVLNTFHSLALPILRYKHLPFAIALIVLFLVYCHFSFTKNTQSTKSFLKQGMIVLVFITISFFIPSYLLSDIVPDRAASLGYLLGILFLFDYFIFRKDGIKKELS